MMLKKNYKLTTGNPLAAKAMTHKQLINHKKPNFKYEKK
jgi:hypothetical protein